MFCVGSEVNVESGGAVIERLNSKGPGRSLQEFVKVKLKCLCSECRSNAGPFDGTEKLVCSTRPSFVQDKHHLRESPVRNWFHDTAVPQPMFGQRAYLEYAMDHCVTTHRHVDDSTRQVVGLVNRTPDVDFG